MHINCRRARNGNIVKHKHSIAEQQKNILAVFTELPEFFKGYSEKAGKNRINRNDCRIKNRKL